MMRPKCPETDLSDYMTVQQFRQSFGLNVRRSRLAAGMTVEQVAMRLQVPATLIARIEAGEAWCAPEIILALAGELTGDIAGMTAKKEERYWKQGERAEVSGCYVEVDAAGADTARVEGVEKGEPLPGTFTGFTWRLLFQTSL